jgi:hypothetical protein
VIQIDLQQKFNLNSISTIQLAFYLLWAAESPLSLPEAQHSFVFLYFLFHLLPVIVNSQKTNESSTSIPSLFLRATFFVTAPQRKGMKPRNTCDPGDHLASIRSTSFRILQGEAGFEPPKKHNGYAEYIVLF